VEVGLNGCDLGVHVVLKEELACVSVGLRGWAGLMGVCLWLRLRLLMTGMASWLSRDLAVMSCARKM